MIKPAKAVLLVCVMSFVANPAFAYCRDPGRAPEAPRSYDKPKKPACLENVRYGQEPECDQYELDRYQREADRYIEKLQTYADEAQDYAKEALKFAQCEATETRESLR